METRKVRASGKFSPLPVDFLKMVNEVFTSNFDAGIQALEKLSPGKAYFNTSGKIFPDEILLSISLMREDQLAATTVYASVDFDSKASAPTVQELLSACVDAIGAVYSQILDPTQTDVLEAVADQSLSAFKEIPFEWTSLKVERHTIFVRVDKANPKLEELTDEWLRKNDPTLQAEEQEEQQETEKLFVTGDKAKKESGQGGLH